MPSISSLSTCHHTTSVFPVKETWCQAIGKGNYDTWSGLTVELARRHFPNSKEIVLGTMSKKRKNIRSKKNHVTKYNKGDQPNLTTKVTKSNEAHFFIRHSSKTHSDQTDKFPYVARSRNQYLMIA